jgi:hypothetical protein
MKSPFFFLIKPKGSEYKNTIEIAGEKIIINSSVESHENVNRFAEVICVPNYYKGDIKKGDTIVVHHNVFRIYYDMKGRPRKSPNFDPSQFYLYHDGNKWNSVDEFCFIKPISLENKYLHQEGLEENTGVVVYSNNSLRRMGVNENCKINFSKDSEYKFIINNETLYRMKTKDVCSILN